MTTPGDSAGTRTVRVLVPVACAPGCDHVHLPEVVTVTTGAGCPLCGQPRGPITEWDLGLDGTVDTWENPCGHPDSYTDVARQAGVDVATGPKVYAHRYCGLKARTANARDCKRCAMLEEYRNRREMHLDELDDADPAEETTFIKRERPVNFRVWLKQHQYDTAAA